MDDWRNLVLGEVVAFVSDKVELGELSRATYISTENMKPNKGGVELAEKLPPSGKVNAFVPGDTLFSNIRTYFKKVWYADKSGGSSTDVIVFRTLNPAKTDSRFIYYLLSSDAFIDFTVKASKGTKMPRGDKSAMLGYSFLCPPLPVQRKIAAILSAYDDLIENNLRRIKILEAMAQNLYREWFVKFRFPGHQHTRFVDSPLGSIPEGWEVVPFTEIADVLSGGTPKTSVPAYWGGQIPFFAPKDAPNLFYITDTEKSITELGLKKCNSRLYQKDTVFITARGTVGKVVMPSENMAMNQSCYALKGKEGVSQLYLFLATKEQTEYLKRNTSGATFDTIVVDTFRLMKITKPHVDVIDLFSKNVQPLFELLLNTINKNRSLRSTRDLLLPKLISGEVDVSALDIAVPAEVL